MKNRISQDEKKEDFMRYSKLKGFSSDILLVDSGTTFIVDIVNEFLILIGIKKIALLKESEKDDYEIIIKCPHCQNIFYQKTLTKKFICPSCKKKSTIVSNFGTLGDLLMKKKNNVPEDNIPFDIGE